MNKLSRLFSNSRQLIIRNRLITSTRNNSNVEEVSLKKPLHIPVMSREVIQFLDPQEQQIYIDMTFGAGGHSKQILNCQQNIKLYGLDRDPTAYREALKIAEVNSNFVPLLGRFSELPRILIKHGVKEGSVDGILFDLGCSSMQFDNPHRGFALSSNGPLDMRMDGERFPDQPTAADAINNLDFPSLVKIFKVYGDEKHAKKIAQVIIDARFMMKKIQTTQELADIVNTVLPEHRTDSLGRKAHSATKVFQALRIFVNNELNELNYGMKVAYQYLKPGGRVVVLSFHSLEDRIVKRHLIDIDINEPVSSTISQKCKNAALWYSKQNMNDLMTKHWWCINKKVVIPTEEEVEFNPRSRSAKLRAAIKI